MTLQDTELEPGTIPSKRGKEVTAGLQWTGEAGHVNQLQHVGRKRICRCKHWKVE